MTKNNAYLTTNDPMLIELVTLDDGFSGNLIEEWGCVVPEDVIARYKANVEERKNIQDILHKIKKEQEHASRW